MSLLETFEGGDIQEQRALALKKDQTARKSVDELVRNYEWWLAQLTQNDASKFYQYAQQLVENTYISSLVLDVFYDRIFGFSGWSNHVDSGLFLSACMQKMYDENIADTFLIDTTQRSKLSYLGFGLTGTNEKPVTLNVWGGAGKSFVRESTHVIAHCLGDCGAQVGSHAQNLNLKVDGSIGPNGLYHVNHTNVTVSGDCGDRFAQNSKNSQISIIGSVGGNACGSAYKVHFRVNNVGEYFAANAKDSTFEIQGYAANDCAKNVSNITLIVQGSVNGGCGFKAKDSLFTVHGDATGIGKDSSHSEFELFGALYGGSLENAKHAKVTIHQELFSPVGKDADQCSFYSPYMRTLGAITKTAKNSTYYLLEGAHAQLLPTYKK